MVYLKQFIKYEGFGALHFTKSKFLCFVKISVLLNFARLVPNKKEKYEKMQSV